MDGQDDDKLPPPKVRRNKKTKSKSKENKISLLRTLLMRYCFIWKWYVWSLTLVDLHSVVGESWDIRANGRQELCTRSFLLCCCPSVLASTLLNCGNASGGIDKVDMVRRTMLILSWLLSTTWWSGAGILRRSTQSEHRERIRTFFPKTLHKTIHKGFSLVSQWLLKN